MPDPKDGTPGTIVAPTAPTAAEPADTSDPGQMEELKQQQKLTKTGKYGSVKVDPHDPNSEENKEKKNWIEVMLIDDADEPVAGESVEVELPDKTVASGTTDNKGLFRVDNIDPGSCKIKFTDLDKEAWEPA